MAIGFYQNGSGKGFATSDNDRASTLQSLTLGHFAAIYFINLVLLFFITAWYICGRITSYRIPLL